MIDFARMSSVPYHDYSARFWRVIARRAMQLGETSHARVFYMKANWSQQKELMNG